MARPRKIGLDYFPVKVNLSTEVKFAMDDHGEVEVAGIYLFLLSEIYSEYGYYMHWSERILRSFAKRRYCDVTVVGAVVDSLVKNGEFEADLFARYGILTSAMIQANYVRACEKREEVVIVKDYNLLDQKDTSRPNIVFVNLTASETTLNNTSIHTNLPRNSSGYSPETQVSSAGNSPEIYEKSFPGEETPITIDGNPQTKINNTRTNNNRTTVGTVDNLTLTTRMTEILGTDLAQRWLTMTSPNGGPDYCAAQMALMDKQSHIKQPRQWLLVALEKNYAKWRSTGPRLNPNCPYCGGKGIITDFKDNITWSCGCSIGNATPATAPGEQQATASDPNHYPATLAAASVRLQA